MVYAFKGFLTPSFSTLIGAVGIIPVWGPSQGTHTRRSLTPRGNLEYLEMNLQATGLDDASLRAFPMAQK